MVDVDGCGGIAGSVRRHDTREVVAGQGHEVQLSVRSHSSGAWPAVQERDLAEALPGTERGHAAPTTGDVGGAVDDDVVQVANVALCKDGVACVHRDGFE